MLKSISNLGTVLSKSDQKAIAGGHIDCNWLDEILHCWGANARCFCVPKPKGGGDKAAGSSYLRF